MKSILLMPISFTDPIKQDIVFDSLTGIPCCFDGHPSTFTVNMKDKYNNVYLCSLCSNHTCLLRFEDASCLAIYPESCRFIGSMHILRNKWKSRTETPVYIHVDDQEDSHSEPISPVDCVISNENIGSPLLLPMNTRNNNKSKSTYKPIRNECNRGANREKNKNKYAKYSRTDMSRMYNGKDITLAKNKRNRKKKKRDIDIPGTPTYDESAKSCTNDEPIDTILDKCLEFGCPYPFELTDSEYEDEPSTEHLPNDITDLLFGPLS